MSLARYHAIPGHSASARSTRSIASSSSLRRALRSRRTSVTLSIVSYPDSGRPSIPPEQLLRSPLLQVLHTVRFDPDRLTGHACRQRPGG